MVQYCVVPCCKNSALIPGIRFHCFPRNPMLKKLWEIKIRRDSRKNKPISSTMRVCSEHFTESDYNESPRNKDKLLLKKDAVPSIFSFDAPNSKPKRKVRSETDTSIHQENAGVAILEQDLNPVINKQCSEASRTVPKENASAATSEENDPYLMNEIPCIEDYLEVSMAVAEENLSVANQEENTPNLVSEQQFNEKCLVVSMAVPKENLSVSNQEGNILNLVSAQQVNEKCLLVSMAVPKENGIVEVDTKLLAERVKKLEEELATVKSENSTLRSLVTELTTELLKYKIGREYT